MTKLNYSHYLKEKDFNINKRYIEKIYKPKFTKPSENILTRYNKYKKQNILFKSIFRQVDLKQILLADENELKNLINKITPRINALKKDHKKVINKKIEDLFKYADKYQSVVLTPFFTKNFNFRTCFYCNKDFITNFNKDDFDETKEVSTFQLDHFYDKGTYPYLALSLYNLIPSCPTCNSPKVKGSENCFQTCKAPNDKNFDFENKVKFKLFLDKDCKNLHLKDKEDIDTPLKEQFSNDYDKYIEIFKLNERYKAHKDIVYEMITKAELYPESRLKELQDLTGIPFQQIKKDIFKLSDEEDLSKKPFSKLIKDISEELGLI